MYDQKCRKTAMAMRTAAMILAAAVMGGCLADYGRLKSNPEVVRQFESHQMVPGYRYYYTGRAAVPTALIGIDPAYELGSDFWHPIAPDEFKTMVQRAAPDYGNVIGAHIVSPAGDIAGVWFSYKTGSTIRFENDRIFAVPPRRISDPGR